MTVTRDQVCDDAIADLNGILGGYRFRFVTETDLQNGIEQALIENRIPFVREKPLSKQDRPDFMINGIAVEIKIKGTLASVLRQISRYADHDAVAGILVVGTPRWIPTIPRAINGKPVSSLRLIGSLL